MVESNSSSRRRITWLVLPILGAILYQFLAGPRLTLNDPAISVTMLTEEQLAEFRSRGFVVVRELFPADKKDSLVQAGHDYFHKFHILDRLFQASFAKLGLQIWRQEQQFAETALFGALPAISAQLLNHPKSIRLLKDGFFGFSAKNNTGCGFHIDDRGFWPATDSTTGVNFWIALSNISAEEGGGIRVVNQSALDPEDAKTCLAAIRPGEQKPYTTTCRMHELSPSCHEKMMEASVVHDMEPGDALIWDRNTFHRSEPFQVQDVQMDEPKLRYTARYVPGEAIAEGMLHPSVEQGQPFDTAYHPQVWPEMSPQEKKEIEQGLDTDLPIMPILIRMVKRMVFGG